MRQPFLDGAELAAVAAAVRIAEARSLGEIVPVVVPRCAAWTEAQDRGGIAAAMLATLLYLAAGPDWPLWALPATQVVAFGVGYAAARLGPLQRLLIGKEALRAAAQARARSAFHEHGLDDTVAGTGVLVFAAIHERQVVILGDKAVSEKMGPKGWEEAVHRLTEKLHEGHAADGFCAAIELVGQVLERHFPRQGAADVNELPDDLRVH